MARAKLNPVFELFTGTIGNLIFRRAHTGKITVMYKRDMSHIKWSSAQKAHRERFREAVLYAKAAMEDPDILPVYEQMAAEKKNNKRPFDMAVSDYFAGNDLFRKKLYGDQKKPDGW